MQDRAQVVWKSCQQGTVTRLGAALRTAAALSDKDLAVEVEELGREAASSSSSSALFSLHLALQRLHTVLVRLCSCSPACPAEPAPLMRLLALPVPCWALTAPAALQHEACECQMS